MSLLTYKPGAETLLERLAELYARQAGDRIFASMEVPLPALAAFARQHPGGFCEYPDPEERAAFWDELLRQRVAIDDDAIPAAYLSEMDQGLYGGALGGEVQFLAHPENGWISSMVRPLLRDWSELPALRFDPHHPWVGRYRRQMTVFGRRAAGKWGISHFILIDGLNFAFELMGATQTYMALEDCPTTVRRVIELAYDLNMAVQEMFFESVPLLAGGTCSNMVQWVPGRIVSESVDPFHMTSVAYFEKWGREPVESIFRHFDGGVLHIHGNGRHLLEAVSSLVRLKAIFLGDDKGFAPAASILPELRRRAGDMPLVLMVRYPEFMEKLGRHELPGGVFYIVQGVPDADTANGAMEAVRAYRM